MFDLERIRKRELNPRCKYDYLSIGFSVDSVTSLTRLKSKIQHRGCINTASWNKDGTRLVTGSDDRTVKIWNTSKSFEDITIVQTIHTSHRGNIFCAESQPYHESNIVSCAADGVLLLNDINIPRNNSKHLMTTSLLMHMFHFDIEQPHVLYTAEECGVVSRVDLRISGSEKIFSNKRKGYVSPIKTLAQSFVLGANNLFLGGDGYFIDLHDLRLLSQVNKEYRSSYVMNDCHLHTSAVKVFTPHCKVITDNNQSQSYSYNWKNEGVKKKFITSEVSLSGMQIGKDGTTLLANFQGDQIYSFDILGSTNSYSNSRYNNRNDDGSIQEELSLSLSSSSTSSSHHYHRNRHQQCFQPSTNSILYKTAYKHDTDKIVGAKACYGGHFNYATFLKSVSFFGPEDEYIVAGCDSGRLWIWDTKSAFFQGRNQHQKDELENQSSPSSSSSSSSSLIYDTENDALNILPDTAAATHTNHEHNIPLNSHTGRIVNILKADHRTCNGVVAHPFVPLLISYGIDSDVKVFASAAYACASDNDSGGNDEYSNSSGVHSMNSSSLYQTSISNVTSTGTAASTTANDNSTITIKSLKIVRKSTQIYILPNDAYIKNSMNNMTNISGISTATSASLPIPPPPARVKSITRYSSYSEMLDLPKILEDNKDKLHLSRRCAVFDPDQYAIHISAIRQHSSKWRDVLPQEYYVLDEGPDCPSDVAVNMRVGQHRQRGEGGELNVREMAKYILDVLRTSSPTSSSSAAAPNKDSSNNSDLNHLVNDWLTALNQLKVPINQPKQSSTQQRSSSDTFVNFENGVGSSSVYMSSNNIDTIANRSNDDSTNNGNNKVNHNNKREKVSRSSSSKNNYRETTSFTSTTAIDDACHKTTSSSSSTSTPISKRIKTEEIGNTAAEGEDDDDDESFATSEGGDTTTRTILDSSQRRFTNSSASSSNMTSNNVYIFPSSSRNGKAATDSNASKDESDGDISDNADVIDGSDITTVIDDSMWKTLVLCELFRLAAKAKQNGNNAMKNSKQQGGGGGEIAVYFYLKAKRYCDYISANLEDNSFEVFPFKSHDSNTSNSNSGGNNATNSSSSSKNATSGGGTSSRSKGKIWSSSPSSAVPVYVRDEVRFVGDGNNDDSGVIAQSTANNNNNNGKSSSQTAVGTAGSNDDDDGSDDSVVDMNDSNNGDSDDEDEDDGSDSSAAEDNEYTESIDAYLLNSVWRWRFGGTTLHDDDEGEEDEVDGDDDDDHSYEEYSNDEEENSDIEDSNVEESSNEENSNEDEDEDIPVVGEGDNHDDESSSNESVDDEEHDDDSQSSVYDMSISIEMHSSSDDDDDNDHNSRKFEEEGDSNDDSSAFFSPQPLEQQQLSQQTVSSYDTTHSSNGCSNMMVMSMTVGDDSNMSAAAAELNNPLTVSITASSAASSSNTPAISSRSGEKEDNIDDSSAAASHVKFFNIISPIVKSSSSPSSSSASQSLFHSVTQQQQSNVTNDKQPETAITNTIIAKHDYSRETEDNYDKDKNKKDDKSNNKDGTVTSPSTVSISPDTTTPAISTIMTSTTATTTTTTTTALKQQYSSVHDVLQSICATAKTEILEKQRIQLVSTSLANLIAAYIMAEEYAEAKRTCDRLVVFNKMWHIPLDAKFYYSRGSIHYHLHEHHKAQEDLNQSNTLAVTQTGKKDALVNQLLEKVKSALEKEREQEKKLYAGMLKKKQQSQTGDNYNI